jgi:hypothetical protein
MRTIYLNIFLIAIFLFTLLSCGEAPEKNIPAHLPPKGISADKAPECRRIFKIRRGSNFYELLTVKMGFSPEEAAAAVEAVKDSIDLRHIHPKDKFFLVFDSLGNSGKLIYHPAGKPFEWVIRQQKDTLKSSFSLSRKYLPLTRVKPF